MYEHELHYPDGLTPEVIDAYCVEAFGSAEPVPDERLWLADRLDVVEADHRRTRRAVRQATTSVVRHLPRPSVPPGATGGEAA